MQTWQWNFPGPSSPAPSGKSFYFQITVGNTASDLGSLVTIPSWPMVNMPGTTQYPTRVSFAVVAGQAGSPTVRVTIDGQTTPHIANGIGWLLSDENSYFGFQCPQQIANGGIKLIASAAGTLVTCIFEH